MYSGNIKCASINSPARSVRHRGLLTHSKTRSNPESNVALMTLSGLEVLVSLTTDTGKILAKLHQVSSSSPGVEDSNFMIVVFL